MILYRRLLHIIILYIQCFTLVYKVVLRLFVNYFRLMHTKFSITIVITLTTWLSITIACPLKGLKTIHIVTVCTEFWFMTKAFHLRFFKPTLLKFKSILIGTWLGPGEVTGLITSVNISKNLVSHCLTRSTGYPLLFCYI